MIVPMMIPSGDPNEVAELRARVALLERVLVTVVERLVPTTSASAGNFAAAREAIAEVGKLAKAGRAADAARQYRELLGVTWDQAHAAVARWSLAHEEELARWLWLRRWIDKEC